MVEATAPDTVTLDVTGLERIFGLPQDIAAAIVRRAGELELLVNVAVARTPDAAVFAALGFAGVSVLPHGDEAKYLGDLPLGMLPATPEIFETLDRWGIRRFRDLAALPEIGLAGRLGEEGLRLQQLARGELERPLIPVDAPLRFEEEMELEYPVDLLEPLSFLLARILNGVCTRLATRGLATNELRLRLDLENSAPHDRTLRMPVPMLDPKAFLKLLQLDLGQHPPAAPVVRIRFAAEPVLPRVAQTGLFVPIAPEPEKLEITLARLAALVGAGHVGCAELPDTHRPGAFTVRKWGTHSPFSSPQPAPTPYIAFRVFRPPRTAQVGMVSGHPAHVYADGIRGSVVSFAGPWRTSGDWWRADAWGRDEWDVALQDGALYRLYCEHATGRWFVEGSYD